MLSTPITAADLAPALLALDALDADATTLRDCDAFAAWCDERREAWVAALEAEAAGCDATEAA